MADNSSVTNGADLSSFHGKRRFIREYLRAFCEELDLDGDAQYNEFSIMKGLIDADIQAAGSLYADG